MFKRNRKEFLKKAGITKILKAIEVTIKALPRPVTQADNPRTCNVARQLLQVAGLWRAKNFFEFVERISNEPRIVVEKKKVMWSILQY